MKTITTHTNVYEYDELTPEAKEKALENQAYINVEHDWYDYIDESDRLEGTGIKCDSRGLSFDIYRGNYLYFSPFRYTKKTTESKEIHGEHQGIWIENMDSLATTLCKDKVLTIKQKNAVKRGDLYLSIGRKVYGGGSGKNYLSIEAGSDEGDKLMEDIDEDKVSEWLESKLDDMLKGLRKEYQYQTSREAIEETIRANEYEFTSEGKLF